MSNFQLIVPMTGTGQRFKDAGYSQLKPMIEINGRSFFEYVVDMFPTAKDILFIISRDEPQKVDLLERIHRSYPHAEVVEILAHKLGPSYALLQAADWINETKKIIVSYCDYHAVWNPSEMLDQLEEMDGSILTYTGFHPHMARSDKYAYVTKIGKTVTAIQEKTPFTDTPMNEEASAGCYGFSSKQVLIQALQNQIKSNLSFNGEFYTSLTYRPIIQNAGKVGTVVAQKFSQWGTPEDFADWRYWNDFRKHDHATCQNCAKSSELAMSSIILAAGAGKRIEKFSKTSKPNIPVGSLRLWEFSRNLAKRGSIIVVTRKEIGIESTRAGREKLIEIEGMTEGQASTAQIGLESIAEENKNPVHIFSSDNIMCAGSIDQAMNEIIVADLVVWTVTGYPPAQYAPDHYSWLSLDKQNKVKGVVAKSAPKDLMHTPLIIGNFTFKNSNLAKELISYLQDNEIRVNNEFYLDSVIDVALQQGMVVSFVQVKSFMALGTEYELNVHNYYWNSIRNENG